MRRAFALIPPLLTALAAAQDPQQPGTDPIDLVARGEALGAKAQIEDAALLLWQALDLLAAQPEHALGPATTLSARHLLKQHDPREPERRRVFASIARQQVELARAYRLKKWFDTAATRLDVAARYDGDEVGKERTLLAAALPKPKAEVASPTPAKEPDKLRPSPLLQRENTVVAFGKWREVEERLECEGHPGGDGELNEWITKSPHADHEIVVEFQPALADKDYNCCLGVGQRVLEGTTHFSGFRALAHLHPQSNQFSLMIWEIRGQAVDMRAQVTLPAAATADGFHRLSVQVRGKALAVHLDGHPPLLFTATEPVTGNVALFVGINTAPSCAVRFRNFRIDPLPADMPSDDEVRRRAETERQNRIVAAVDEAKELLTRKQPEAASLRLRDALTQVRAQPAGVLRDNLASSIEAMLTQADPLASKRKKVAQGIAAELIALADTYAAAGMARLALVLAQHAAAFDEVQAPRLAAALDAVRAWNVAQAAARAAELQPPDDDGTVLREWFAEGQPLDSRFPKWIVEGASARVENLGHDFIGALMPKTGTAPLGKATVHVRLPAAGLAAGFCFDVAGWHDFAVAFLVRTEQGLELRAHRSASGKWIELKGQAVAVDAWRLDGWFAIEIEAVATGITIRSEGVELRLDRQRLGNASGRFGLFAGNSAVAPATIALRAFQVKK